VVKLGTASKGRGYLRRQRAETLSGKSTAEFTSKRKQFGSSENIYSYAKRGEREMKKGCEVKHLPWQMLHNTRAKAVFEWK